MASRQNREMRSEYPTGHNKGNESPSRRVPRNPGGANPVEPAAEPDVPTYGAPMGVPEVDEGREAEREAKLGQEATPEERGELIEEHIQEGIDETLRGELETQADARTGAGQPGPTQDLSAAGAAAKIAADKKAKEDAALEAGK